MTSTSNNLEPNNIVYKTLLESTKAIPWQIDWKSMTFSYIGPQIEALLGWKPESWVSAKDWASRIHEDDRDKVVNFCISQSKAGVDHEADYRALTADGNLVWIRDVVHVVRDANGEVDSLVGFMFDISERKKTEEKLLSLQKELEDYSYKDSLTGVANRRMFDSMLDLEWAKALTNKEPLSLLMIDIDCFKQYNDFYGHIKGDECLKRVAQLLSSAGARSRDFFARYGGEEFIWILPDSDCMAALKVAERCQSLIIEAGLAHAQSTVSDVLTISIGVGCIVPSREDSIISFIDTTDKRLYLAKQNGRNRIER